MGRSECAKLARTDVVGVDQLNPICPRRAVDAAGLAEIQQHRPGAVQQGEDAQRAVVSDQVEIGHAASEQRVSLAKVVTDVQARHHRGEQLAGLVLWRRSETTSRAALERPSGRQRATCASVFSGGDRVALVPRQDA
jgi:hypothetical protein